MRGDAPRAPDDDDDTNAGAFLWSAAGALLWLTIAVLVLLWRWLNS